MSSTPKPRNSSKDSELHKESYMEHVFFKRLSPSSIIPQKASSGSAGLDLHCMHDCTMPARQATIIRTGLSIDMPLGYYGQIAARSGMALHNLIQILGGVIDNDYTGEIRVLLFNNGDNSVEIRSGDRIAQLIITRYADPIVHIRSNLNSLTDRGDKGFGSTGR